jgi:hypothetical protein
VRKGVQKDGERFFRIHQQCLGSLAIMRNKGWLRSLTSAAAVQLDDDAVGMMKAQFLSRLDSSSSC